MVTFINLKVFLLNLLAFGITLRSVSHGRPIHSNIQDKAVNQSNFRVKGVNLGGWLVTEGWIKPSLFDGISNKDFLDGNRLQFKSMTTQKYLCAESGGGTVIVANCTNASGWENFRLWRINQTTFRFRVSNDQFVGLDGIKVVAVVNTSTDSETFEIVKESNASTRVRIKASNGFFLQAKTEELVTADISNVRGWEDNDPTIFNLTIAKTIEGEFQLTNGYGPDKAPQVMKEHWNTFIVEDDFKFIAENGLNAVRIPVGWWTASDPTPPPPFVGGSLQVLDNAFLWAQRYGLKIILDLHAAPGSQNGAAHSASRDGSIEWGKTDESIQQTLHVIDFFTARYAKSGSLYAVELLNEPLAPHVTLETLTKYYKAGYKVVRQHSLSTYVILCARLKFSKPDHDTPPPQELFSLASEVMPSVLDVHWYSLYYDIFDNLSARQNIDYIHSNRTSQLNHLSPANLNGPLTYVGEWTGEWNVKNATKEDYQRFAKAQLDVYGRATFGWSYWNLKNAQNHWSLQWMINNGYIKFETNGVSSG